MTCECYYGKCQYHYDNSGSDRDEGPFCDEPECLATTEQVIQWDKEKHNKAENL